MKHTALYYFFSVSTVGLGVFLHPARRKSTSCAGSTTLHTIHVSNHSAPHRRWRPFGLHLGGVQPVGQCRQSVNPALSVALRCRHRLLLVGWIVSQIGVEQTSISISC